MLVRVYTPRSMAFEDVDVRPGDRVRLTWFGGNGPHEYIVRPSACCGHLFAAVDGEERIDPVRCLTAPVALQRLEVLVRPGPSDFDTAHDEWGANCGPASLAAALDLKLADVREAVSEGGRFRGYMSITNMRAALHRLGIRHESVPPCGLFDDWTALVCVQWEGSWSSSHKAAACKRHWVARRGQLLYEVLANEWMPMAEWEGAVSALYPRRATGHSFGWACVLERRHGEV